MPASCTRSWAEESYSNDGWTSPPRTDHERRGVSMSLQKAVTHYRWDSMRKERVSDMLERRLITGDRMMLAHVYLKKGCIVPKHSHDNEQLTYILEGALHFKLGEDQ